MKKLFPFLNVDQEPYLIAEIGVNHEGSIDKAKKLIELAKEGGADAVKFQTYKAELIASKISPSYWDLSKEKTKSQFELFKKFDCLKIKDYEILYNFTKSIGLEFSSTPFDLAAAKDLSDIVDFYKIASADITFYPLLEFVSKTNKPVVISTGASNLEEIKSAVKLIEINSKFSPVIMHCILNYPTKDENANLLMIKSLKENFSNYIIGLSDHTSPNRNLENLIYSYLLGSAVIEKHFTSDKSIPGNDHYHSMDSEDIKNFRKKMKEIKSILGEKEKKCIASEEISRKNARRSIYTYGDLKKNEILTSKNIICKRPGEGISPERFNEILGKKLNKDLEDDTLIKWEDLT